MCYRLSKLIETELKETALTLATPGKGILAADETANTIGKKFTPISLENNKENRRLYRQMLFGHEQIGQYLSGVIMHEETAHQTNDQGISFLQVLQNKSIIPGIKVDKGLSVLLGTNSETATQGLDDLRTRCEEYYRLGFRFAKWRAVLKIGEHEPSTLAINENAHGLARYAAICQECRLVPIVEPDVLQDGRHTIDKCQQVCEKVLAATFKALNDYNVLLEGILLKPNMIMSGHDCPLKANYQQIGLATVNTLFRTVPPAVPGIMFLSGGQSEHDATVNLNSINKIINQAKPYKPWHLSFSFGRALQNTAINTWSGKMDNVERAQLELIKRLKANSLACQGLLDFDDSPSPPTSSTATQSNFVSKHVY